MRFVRYRFGDFVLSPARRVLLGGGRAVPLIPRYFDLLVLLVEQRDRAVGKQEIFDRVWSGMVVSESALTQAVRTIRLALGDDPREPRFVRTVSRRGYQFVFAPVAAEPDAGPLEADAGAAEQAVAAAAAGREDAQKPLRGFLRPIAAFAASKGAAAGVSVAAVGTAAGLVGGLALRIVSGSQVDAQVALTLAIVGALAGALGGTGIGAGLAAADAVARSGRPAGLALGGAAGGLAIGWLAHHAARAVLFGIFGHDIPAMGGPVEGLVLGAAVGLGYAVGTLPQGTHAVTDALRGAARWRVAGVTAVAAALGAAALALAGRHLVGSSLDLMASAFAGSQVGLEPLARLLGEDGLRPVTRVVVSAIEGLLLGGGIAFGLTMSGPPAVEPSRKLSLSGR